LCSSVLIIAVIAAIPYSSYDFPPQILLDEFMPSSTDWGYSLWVDEGSWVAIEINADVQVNILVVRQFSETETHHIGSWTVYSRIVTLRSGSSGQDLRISVNTVRDGNVTVEIIDSSQSLINSVPILLFSPWFLFLCIATLVLDVYVVLRWSSTRSRIGRKQQDGIDGGRASEELRFSKSYVTISRLRELRRKLFGKREES
jgi:hypothetical protein